MNAEAVVTIVITILSLAAAYLSHKNTGPVMSIKYLLLSKNEKAAADRAHYYRLAAVQFLFIAAIFACAALVSITGSRLILFAMPVICMAYVLISEHT